MTEKTSNKNGARGHPLNPDKEKILISQEAKTERKARQKANLPDTAFRQAEKADRFAVREDVFSAEADAEKKTTSKLLKTRRSRLKKSYAKDVRHELGQENPADQRGGIRTKATGKSQSTAPKGHFYSEENLKKDGAFFVGEKRSKGRKAIRRFSRQKISSAAENAVISQKEDMFYGSDDDYNVSAEVAKKAKAAQKRLIRKSYQTAEESAVYIPIVSRIRERAKARSGQATANGDEELLVDASEKFINADFIAKYNAAHGKNLKLSGETADIGGGFIARAGRTSVNCSFPKLIDWVKESLQSEVVTHLFGADAR